MTLLDVGGLERLARAIDEHAGTIRLRAGRLVGAAQAARWNSTAAVQFRDQVGDVAGGLRACADRLERAARTLRGHARTVRAVEEAIKAAERAVEATADLVDDAAEQAARATSSFVRAIGRRI